MNSDGNCYLFSRIFLEDKKYFLRVCDFYVFVKDVFVVVTETKDLLKEDFETLEIKQKYDTRLSGKQRIIGVEEEFGLLIT